MPGQLIFGRDMVLNVHHLTDWTAIKTRKHQIILKNNRIENSKQIPHHYQAGDLVMLENNRVYKYEQPYSRPYRITQVKTNGTVRLKINAVTDTVNIRCIHSFKTPNSNCGGESSMRRAKDRRERVN
jgi:hypothetical protein